MKNITLIIAAILISGSLLAQTQPLNPSFENWTTAAAGFDNPDSWTTTNLDLGFMGTFVNVTEETTGAQDGTSFIRLETKDPGTGALPGVASLGIIDVANQTVTGGMPYTDRPEFFKGYYNYNGVNGDTCSLIAFFTKWDGTTRDTIGFSFFMTDANTSNWTMFTDTIYWDATSSPDTLNIIVASSSSEAMQVGSILDIDNLFFEGTVVGVEDNLSSEELFDIYPNPVKDVINVRINNGENAEITLYNTVGQQVYKTNTSTADNKINVSQQNRGIYFIKVKLDNKVYTKKVFLN